MKQFFEDIQLNETQLILQAQSGCTKSRDKVFFANARFAIFEARKRQMRHLEDELIQVASVGLFRAIDLFDTTKKNKFISYAVWYIKSELNLWLSNNYRTIRLPSNICANIRTGKNESSEFAFAQSASSFEPELLDNFNSCLDSTIEEIDVESKKEKIDQILSTLKPKEKEVVNRRLGFFNGEKQTFREIGDDLKMTHQHAKGLFDKSMRFLRSKYSEKEFIAFFM